MSQFRQTNLSQSSLLDEEVLAEKRKQFRAGPVERYFTRPVLIAILVLAILTGLISIIEVFSLDNSWSRLLPLFLFVALEAIYTTNWLNHPDRLVLNRSTYRVVEFFLILLIAGMVTLVVFSNEIPTREDLMANLLTPFSLFFDGRFIVTVFLTLVTWSFAINLSTIFCQLEISEFELRFYSLPAHIRKERSDDRPIQVRRRRLVDSFKFIWIFGGILLILCLAILSVDLVTVEMFLRPLAIKRLGLPPTFLTMLLLYLGIGFWLLSQASFMEKNAHWLINDVRKDKHLKKTWQRFSLFAILLVAVIGAFIPIGPTAPISNIINIIIYWVLLLGNILIFLILWPIGALLALFRRGSEEEGLNYKSPVHVPSPKETLEQFGSLSDSINMVLISAFWVFFIIILILALIYFLKERKIEFKGRSFPKLWSIFKTWLNDHLWIFKLWLKSKEINILQIKPKSKAEEPTEAGKQSRWQYIRLGSLSPREQIRYFYLSTLRRARDRGVIREPSETPLEFTEDLRESWPEVEGDIEDLTQAFLRARYSDRSLKDEDISPVKETWKSVRKKIRRLTKPDTPDDRDNKDGPKT